jgi:hypothetical protein
MYIIFKISYFQPYPVKFQKLKNRLTSFDKMQAHAISM